MVGIALAYLTGTSTNFWPLKMPKLFHFYSAIFNLRSGMRNNFISDVFPYTLYEIYENMTKLRRVNSQLSRYKA